MKEVRWTETARKTLQETSEFILEIWDKDVHEEFVDQLDYRIKQLRINPELGPPFRDSQIRLCSLLLSGNEPLTEQRAGENYSAGSYSRASPTSSRCLSSPSMAPIMVNTAST